MKNKHLTLSDRNDIQIGIEQLKNFSAIATKLGKDPSTISKEVRRNRVVKENSVFSLYFSEISVKYYINQSEERKTSETIWTESAQSLRVHEVLGTHS